MTKLKSLSLSLSSVALLAATPAFADITAEELWSVWQTQATNTGSTLTGQATQTDDGLVITDVTNMVPIEEAMLATVIPEFTMTNNADGTVSLSMSDTLYYSITGIPEPDAPDEIRFVFAQTGFSGTASGDAQNLLVESSIDELSFEASSESMNAGSLQFTGGDLSDLPNFDASILVTGLSSSSTYDFSNPEILGLDGTGGIASFSLTFNASEGGGAAPGQDANPGFSPAPQPQAPGKAGPTSQPVAPTPQPLQAMGGNEEMSLSIALADLTADASVTMPVGIDWTVVEAYPAGFAINGDMSYSMADVAFAFQDDYEDIDFSTSNQGGTIGFGMSEDNLRYALTGQNVQLNISGGDIPFPVSISADTTGFGIDMPLSAQGQPSPFAASMNYRGLSVDEGLWGMIDPTGAIPRTPATVVFDITGTLQLFQDLMMMDPMTMTGPPGEIRDLTINNLQVSVAGAELIGSGDLDFTPGQIIPMPVGQVDLSLTGANTLIGTLSNAGLLPPQQAGMARGMLGMFAIPGASPDSYNSTIEFGPGGSITANGVPLQ